MQQGIFITGTDTGVGKTHVGTGIAAAFRRQGVDAGVFKPVETGCRSLKGKPVPSDARALMRAAGSDDPLELVCPYRFRAPVAPFTAAQLEGERIDRGRILAAYRELRDRHDLMIVEGAGGIMVPLTANLSFLDLVQAFGLPVVIVARPGLGTINHTMLTVMALRSRNVPVRGIVINCGTRGKQGVAERTAPAVMEDLSGIPIIGTIRHGQHQMDALARVLLAPSRRSRRGIFT